MFCLWIFGVSFSLKKFLEGGGCLHGIRSIIAEIIYRSLLIVRSRGAIMHQLAAIVERMHMLLYNNYIDLWQC